jgi:hypothetical protein
MLYRNQTMNNLVMDVFGRDSGSMGVMSRSQAVVVERSKAVGDDWAVALRRHAQTREHWRHLLDKFVVPHH